MDEAGLKRQTQALYKYLKNGREFTITERDAMLIILQGEFAKRNPLFIKEREQIRELNEKEWSNEVRKKILSFRRRWGLRALPGGFCFRPIHFDVPVTGGPNDSAIGELVIQIDLRYSKEKIKDRFNRILDYYHHSYREQLDDEYGKYRMVEMFEEQVQLPDEVRQLRISPAFKNSLTMNHLTPEEILSPKTVNQYILSDLNDYLLMLSIWDLKIEGLSWSKIADQLDIEIYAARNKRKTVDRLICSGLPGFKTFPMK